MSDLNLAREFMFNKMGADTQDSVTLAEGLYAYKKVGLLPPETTVDSAFLSYSDLRDSICLMSSSQTETELLDCMTIMNQNEINRL